MILSITRKLEKKTKKKSKNQIKKKYVGSRNLEIYPAF
jgi:hypothetical protein